MKQLFQKLGACLLLLGCGAAQPAAVPNPQISTQSGTAPEPWLSPFERNHPLTGKIWDVRQHTFLSQEQFLAQVGQARWLLLGEQHDNPDHHRLQARILEALARAQRKPALVFEMLDTHQSPALLASRSQPHAPAQGLGKAVTWEKSGWPPFAIYLPLFEVAFRANWTIAAGNLPRETIRTLMKQGPSALTPVQLNAWQLDKPFPEAQETALLAELRTAHCGQLPETLLAPMALAQHARDAHMAQTMLESGANDGSTLIAGAGHARLDRGVPYYIKQAGAPGTLLSVALREVDASLTDPSRFSPAKPPEFDFLWFTPRISNDDPCANFGKQ